jgi:hypothetical protein
MNHAAGWQNLVDTHCVLRMLSGICTSLYKVYKHILLPETVTAFDAGCFKFV